MVCACERKYVPPRTSTVNDVDKKAMARDAIVHDVDLPSLEYDDEETVAYMMATETPSFDADDATLGSTFVIVDEDTVSDPDDDDDDVAPLVMIGSGTSSDLLRSSSSSAVAGRTKFLDKIKEHKSYQKLVRIVKKKGQRPGCCIIYFVMSAYRSRSV